jgi:hypothetical protein
MEPTSSHRSWAQERGYSVAEKLGVAERVDPVGELVGRREHSSESLPRRTQNIRRDSTLDNAPASGIPTPLVLRKRRQSVILQPVRPHYMYQ